MEIELTPSERDNLASLLHHAKRVKIVLWGEGKARSLSFYGEGTRLEVRIPYPDHRKEG